MSFVGILGTFGSRTHCYWTVAARTLWTMPSRIYVCSTSLLNCPCVLLGLGRGMMTNSRTLVKRSKLLGIHLILLEENVISFQSCNMRPRKPPFINFFLRRRSSGAKDLSSTSCQWGTGTLSTFIALLLTDWGKTPWQDWRMRQVYELKGVICMWRFLIILITFSPRGLLVWTSSSTVFSGGYLWPRTSISFNLFVSRKSRRPSFFLCSLTKH